MAWINPKTDWSSNLKNPVAEDFNRIEGNIDFLKNDIETKKGAVVTALNDVGISVSMNDTYAQIAAKILAGEKTGIVITPGISDIAIPKGIFDAGGGKVLGDPDLISDNIKAGKEIFGKQGKASVVDTVDATIVAGDVLSGKIGYKNGSKITGTIPSKAATNYNPSTVNQVIASAQYIAGVQTLLGSANFAENNIKEGVNMWGKVGKLPVYTVFVNASNNLRLYYDTSEKTTSSTTFARLTAITIKIAGTIKFNVGYASGNDEAYVGYEIRKNGTTLETWQTKFWNYTQYKRLDIPVQVGDVISVWGKASSNLVNSPYLREVEVEGAISGMIV